MAMFIIGANDYSNRVIAGAYSVYSEDIYKEWVDGNHKTHRNIVASKLRGSFDVMFKSIEEYNSFLSVVNSNKTDSGAVAVSLKANNKVEGSDLVTSNCFLSFQPTRNRNGFWKDYMERFTIEVEEE